MSTSASKVVLVTGANKGIGFQFVRLLADKYPSWTILLGSRSQANADAAVAQLGGKQNVHALLIDVDSDDSVRAAAEQVKAKYGRVDVLVDNAAIASFQHSYDLAKSIIATNVFGVKRVDDAFIPLIPEGGRVILVSSEVGSWVHYDAPAALQQTLANDNISFDEVAALANRYVDSTRAPFPNASEFPLASSFGSYGASKMFLSAYGRNQAKKLAARNIAYMMVSPGYCATDLNFNTGPRSSEQGARSYLMALERDGALAGKLFLDDDEVGVSVETPAETRAAMAQMEANSANKQ